MRKIPLNDTWLFWKTGREESRRYVHLPHDAMLAEPRAADNPGGANISWFAGGDYVYERRLTAEVPPGGRVLAEFEGVYRNAEVFLNGERIAGRPYGYIRFYADLTAHIVPGENVLRVVARNAEQPNSRWYTGSGIYRPVSLYTLPARHILLNGIRVTTLDAAARRIAVQIRTSAPGELTVGIRRKGEEDVLWHAHAHTDGVAGIAMTLPGAALWSCDDPALYVCRVDFGEDSDEVTFGVRTVECTAQRGLCINGERVILRGACIHHDNGPLGAAAEPFAERRKIRLLRDAGYNAVRSAHNPCSKALLDACDELGMLVLDEYADMWYIHKTKYDYADELGAWWPQDLGDMVDKDYNHPSVILYSTGNEVAETAQPRGIALTAAMTRRLHEPDGTRPVTCGVNIFFNYLFSLGLGVYSDEKASRPAQKRGIAAMAGSEFYNAVAGVFGASFMKLGAALHGSDARRAAHTPSWTSPGTTTASGAISPTSGVIPTASSSARRPSAPTPARFTTWPASIPRSSAISSGRAWITSARPASAHGSTATTRRTFPTVRAG